MSDRPAVRRRDASGLLALLLPIAIAAAVAGCGSTASPTPSAGGAVVNGAARPSTGTPAPTFSNAKLGELLARLGDATARQASMVRDLTTATSGTPEQIRTAAGAISDWAKGESSWLDAHTPDACFTKAHDSYRRAVTDIAAAAAEFTRLAATGNPPTNVQGQPAGAQFVKGLAEVTEANALATVALRTCG